MFYYAIKILLFTFIKPLTIHILHFVTPYYCIGYYNGYFYLILVYIFFNY